MSQNFNAPPPELPLPRFYDEQPKPVTKKICIYHGNCADGFGAAYAVWKWDSDVEFFPGVYQQDPPDVTGKDVILVDFSYKRDVIKAMAKQARTITILDHHKSAAEDLGFFARFSEMDMDLNFNDFAQLYDDQQAIRALFDMERSGAMIAWEYFHPDTPAPRLIQHIQDRDLWRFALPNTREIQAVIFSHPYDFATWDALVERAEDDAAYSGMVDEGRAIERKHFKDIAELLKVTTVRMIIGGHDVPAANLPYTMSSDAGHQLAQGELFAACYWDTPEGRVFSLRSAEDGMDVSAIAKQYGGGGHVHAAGFRIAPGAAL